MIPGELSGRISLTVRDIFDDSDPFTREIYQAEDLVAYEISADIARAFIDLNRSVEQLPPEFPDGILKSHTCYNKPVYKSGTFPEKDLIDALISKYYNPYHQSIREAVQNEAVLFAFDCHSMAETGPWFSPDRGEKRPLINLGDVNHQSADEVYIKILQKCFEECFEIGSGEVSVNNPFKGGYITRQYGRRPKPWIQIELNRSYYLADPWFDQAKLQVDPDRLKELNSKMRRVFNSFYQQVLQLGH